MSIVVVGSVAFDTIATPSGRADNVLGGAATYFALAASYFTDVRVVAVVGDDFTAEHENVMTKRGLPDRYGAPARLSRCRAACACRRNPPMTRRRGVA